jgi:hypothetical protein
MILRLGESSPCSSAIAKGGAKPLDSTVPSLRKLIYPAMMG